MASTDPPPVLVSGEWEVHPALGIYFVFHAHPEHHPYRLQLISDVICTKCGKEVPLWVSVARKMMCMGKNFKL
jgi:hypothetical protein